MNSRAFAVCAFAAITALSGAANAADCAKGAVVGGVAGHVAGHHALLGAGAGCLIARHHAKKAAQQQAAHASAAKQDRVAGYDPAGTVRR